MSYINSLQNRDDLTSQQKKELANKEADKLQAEAERLTETAGTRKYLKVRAENLKREARAIRNVTTWYTDPRRYKQSQKKGTPSGEFKDPRPIGVEKGKEDIPLSSRSTPQEKQGTIILYSKQDNSSISIPQTKQNLKALKEITEQENKKDITISRDDFIKRILKAQGKEVTQEERGDIVAISDGRKTTITAEGDIVVTPVSAKVRGEVLKESLSRQRFHISGKTPGEKEKEKSGPETAKSLTREIAQSGAIQSFQSKMDAKFLQREEELTELAHYMPSVAIIGTVGLKVLKGTTHPIRHPIETAKAIYKSTALPGGEATPPSFIFPFATPSAKQLGEQSEAFVKDPLGYISETAGGFLFFKGLGEIGATVLKKTAKAKIVGTQGEEIVTLEVPGGSVSKVKIKTTVKVGRQLFEILGEGKETAIDMGDGRSAIKGRYTFESGDTVAKQVVTGERLYTPEQTKTVSNFITKTIDKGKVTLDKGELVTRSQEIVRDSGLSRTRYLTEVYKSDPVSVKYKGVKSKVTPETYLKSLFDEGKVTARIYEPVESMEGRLGYFSSQKVIKELGFESDYYSAPKPEIRVRAKGTGGEFEKQSTIAHEITHSQQDPKKIASDIKTKDYLDRPTEKQAFKEGEKRATTGYDLKETKIPEAQKEKFLSSKIKEGGIEGGIITEQAKVSEGIIKKTLATGESKYYTGGDTVKEFTKGFEEKYIIIEGAKKGISQPPSKQTPGVSNLGAGGSSSKVILKTEGGASALSSLKEGAKAVAKVKYTPKPQPYTLAPKMDMVKTGTRTQTETGTKEETGTRHITKRTKAQKIIIKGATIQRSVLKTTQAPAQDTSQEKATITGQGSSTVLKVTPISEVIQEQTPAQDTQQRQENISKVIPDLRSTQTPAKITLVTPTYERPPDTFIPAIPSKVTTTPQRKREFGILVRRRGRFEPIGSADTPEEAFRMGSLSVSASSSASFKVIETGTNEPLNVPVDLFLNPKKFRKSKVDPGVFVERRKFRIDTPGEKREITLLGILATKKNKKTFNVFGG